MIILQNDDWRIVRGLNKTYAEKLLKESFDLFVKKRLRYNPKNGTTYLSNKIIAEYAKKEDITEYENRRETIQWQLMSCINNGCSRKLRGYSII